MVNMELKLLGLCFRWEQRLEWPSGGRYQETKNAVQRGSALFECKSQTEWSIRGL